MVGFLLKIPGGGGVSQEVGGGRGGREGVCCEFGGGGLNIFFPGRNAPQVGVTLNKHCKTMGSDTPRPKCTEGRG